MPLQDEVWAGLFLRNSRALAISIIAMVSLVSRATAALATPLQGVHDTFHKALRDGDAAVLDQLLAVQFVWTDSDGHVWNKSDLLAQLRDGKLRYSDFQADLESHAEYGLAAVVSGRSRYRTATAVKPSEFRYTLTLVKIGRAWKVATYHISIMPNSAQPLQVRLGYPANAKLVILNADDLAVSDSEDVASFAALDHKIITSATVMVPCPWFTEVAAYAKAHPGVDLGLHLTFTSEWQAYRRGPVWMRALVPSLVGPDGYFWPNAQEFAKHARLDEVELEIRAQIERALGMGLQPSHLDAHMHSLYVTPDLFRIMLKVAHEYRLPVHMASNIDLFRPGLALMDPGDPVVDSIFSPGEEVPASGWKDYYVKLVKNLQPGSRKSLCTSPMTMLNRKPSWSAISNGELPGDNASSIPFPVPSFAGPWKRITWCLSDGATSRGSCESSATVIALIQSARHGQTWDAESRGGKPVLSASAEKRMPEHNSSNLH